MLLDTISWCHGYRNTDTQSVGPHLLEPSTVYTCFSLLSNMAKMNMIDQNQLQTHLEQMQTVTLLLLEKALMVPSAQEVRGHLNLFLCLTCLSLKPRVKKTMASMCSTTT